MPIDYSRYPPGWKKEIVPAVLKRANNKCECCGLENGSTAYSIKLDVKDDNGRYKKRTIWFRSKEDAERECDPYYEVKPVKVVLTVAHLDHDETNWDVSLDRLKAMCQLCHLRYDSKEKFRRYATKYQ
ncbi:hypothetical protein [Dyadobacter sp. CY312]|uniref:hypothetical protein n=1 Tax=Dyadobacter sp. CY312 TaxID=2907303 RepID=UPI001F413229|nr:hypothetical protein [Dyadobacter sp. CY312]MCE7039271.1 hypothetical protein [Dyadobacter sp. CY312]